MPSTLQAASTGTKESMRFFLMVTTLMLTGLPPSARAAAVHGLQYRYNAAGGSVRHGRGHIYQPAHDSCRQPRHDQVLMNYSKGEFLGDQATADEMWGVGNAGTVEQKRYIVVRKLAEGAEGAVYEAIDRKTNKFVVIKKVSNMFDGDNLFVPRQVLAEVKSLGVTRASPDFMTLNRMILPRYPHSFDTAYIVLDMLEATVPRAGTPNAGNILEPEAAETLRLRVFQLVRGMAFLHSAGVVHGDLRWFNVMLDTECNVRIIDLGDLLPIKKLREGRIINTFPGFGPHEDVSRDLWMMGTTILTWVGGKEMYIDKSGKSDFERAKLITSIVGTPSAEELTVYSEKIKASFHKAAEWFSQADPRPPTLEERFPKVDPRLFSLVRRIMRVDRQATSATELLKDPYFESLHRHLPVTVGPAGAVTSLMSIWEDCKTPKVARRMILDEILKNRNHVVTDHADLQL